MGADSKLLGLYSSEKLRAIAPMPESQHEKDRPDYTGFRKQLNKTKVRNRKTKVTRVRRISLRDALEKKADRGGR